MHKIFEDFFDGEKLYVRGEISSEQLRIINPKRMPNGIKSAVVFLVPYYTGSCEDRNVSLYAVSKDYHLYVKELGARLVKSIKEAFPEEEFYCFCDNSPISDISAAITAGLGVLGKNRLLINETYGSYVFIGSVLTTLEASNPANCKVKSCLECNSCLRHCSFLSGDREFCLSELNQRKNVTEEELDVIRSQKIRWGCDDCQQVCPMNKDVKPTPLEFFYEDRIENVSKELLEQMPENEFASRAYSWRGKKTVLRNL